MSTNGAKDQAHIQQYDYTRDDGWTIAFSADAESFCAFVDAVNALVDECILRVSPDGLRAKAVDPANVSMVEAELTDIRDLSEETVVGIDIIQLARDLPNYHEGDEYRIAIDAGDNELRVHSPEGLAETILIDPDTVREEPTGPEVEYEQAFTIPAYRFHGVVGSVAWATDGVVRVGTSEGTLSVHGEREGHADWQYPWGIEADVGGQSEVLYSGDYLRRIFDGLPSNGDLDVQFGTNLPLSIDAGWVWYLIAPRITEVDEYDVGQ